ncbi:asparagine synthase (glutamine-hydrolyzing) [Halalkalibacter akibai]|uniref:asparagine synthase (glutamine-hydrolyzing) n=1 Tax=Halalkalibacter akibai (strain ATCC 43226 / DSM 21942 / CIP 109018 / JCM 9157 / 1139) TaxID=1236973 RepID=W4QXW4_HALA3|nr:asparagine synthase (glutamine-hydrolyzing) [Halalkalibacter akibai]GAE36762.1 asparagine synthetase [Halalkalibacter akibai JCM 9157]
MCGFVACVYNKPLKYDQNTKIREMNKVISHRGPDQEGYMTGEHVELGFSRLSIIDLEGGYQPLSYGNGRYWIVFNGEIYNYLELKQELIEKGNRFETDSDTEVLLALYSEEGKDAVKKLRGMFAFVIWDHLKKEAFAARDHFGIKPLFYAENQLGLRLASEKKSLVSENDKLNNQALHHYMSFQYVPEPLTMTEGILKLEPGHYIVKKPGQKIEINQYFKPVFKPINQTEEYWKSSIQEVMYDSVSKHMRSDVPVGAFLSGGIDSTIIAAVAKEMNPKLETFSVGFDHEGYSEIDVAKETAGKLNIKNNSKLITAFEYADEMPKIMWHMDDPLADPACVPLYFVAKEASKKVKVVLSGEGADELFGGYNIYREYQSLSCFDYVPKVLQRALKQLAILLPEGVRGKSFIERGTTPIEERYIGNAKMFNEEEKRQLMANYQSRFNNELITSSIYEKSADQHVVNRMQHLDMHTWLRGDILVKADKMTMAHSLELRVPFLDKEVFELASRIPVDWKTTNGTTKYILRKAFEEIVPAHVFMRRKLGFPVPIRLWLKNELYDWALSIINESETSVYIDKIYMRQLLNEHKQNKADHSRKIWTVLSFMIWHQVYVEKKYDVNEWITKRRIQEEQEIDQYVM